LKLLNENEKGLKSLISRKIILVLVCLFLLGCTTIEEPVGCTADLKLCPDGSSVGRVPPDCEFAPCPTETVEGEMTLEEAIMIAEASDCVTDGNLTDQTMYNNVTKTWWIDLDIEQEGCNPACVIGADGTAEINWRCTGLITP